MPNCYSIIWAVFSVITILGGMATLFPHMCSATINVSGDLDASRFTELVGYRLVHGHHPSCGDFDDHELKLGGKSLCAGCIGLLIGSTLALVISMFPLIYRYTSSPITGYIGLVLVFLGLIHSTILKSEPPALRTIINALFVMGFSLTLVSSTKFGNLSQGLLLISLCVYWMYTRIQLSAYRHDTICGSCEKPCDKKGIV